MGVYLLAEVVTSAHVTAKLWDDRELEGAIYDNAWKLELPWRASRGEWVGRDFHYPLGPVWQLLSWAAAGFTASPPERVLLGLETVMPLLALSIALWIVFRLLERPWPRLMAFTLIGLFVTFFPVPSIRVMVSLLVVVVFALGHGDDAPRRPGFRWALGVTTLVLAAFLITFERGAMALGSIAGVTAHAVVSSAIARRSVVPALHRFGLVLALTLVGAAIVELSARLFGASLFEYLRESTGVATTYAAVTAVPFEGESVGAGPVYAMVACTVAGACLLAIPSVRDVRSGSLLLGVLPLVLTALVRSDPGHVWQGLMPLGAMLAVTALVQLERRQLVGFVLLGIPPLLLWLGWFGSQGWEVSRRLTFRDFAAVVGGRHGDRSYQTDLTRIVRWTRRMAGGTAMRCIGAYQGADVAHALSDLPGPTPTQLRWSGSLQSRLADAIRRARCPYFVQQLSSFIYGATSWYMGEDFVTVAERYRPAVRLGPSVWAMELREKRAPAARRTVRGTGIGRWQTVSVPGKLAIELDEPVSETDLLGIDYTIETPEWVRFSGAVPESHALFALGDEEPWVEGTIHMREVNARSTDLIAVHPWAADWAWMVGQRPRDPRTADRMELEFVPIKDWSPKTLRIMVHRIEVLSPPRSESRIGTPAISDGDLATELRAGRAFPVSASPRFRRGEQGFVLHPNEHEHLHASVYYPLRPRIGSVLRAEVGLDEAPRGGDGADFEIELIDPLGRPLRTALAHVGLEPGAERRTIEVPLDPWAGLDVLLRIGSEERSNADYDWVRVFRLDVGSDSVPATLAGALRGGSAIVRSGTPEIEGSDIYLHPNAAGSPPTEIVVPLRPRPGFCLETSLGHMDDAGRGDGVRFEVGVREGASYAVLLSEHLRPGERRRPPLFSLEQWSGRDVEVVLETFPGADSAYDWAYFLNPRIVRGGCGLTRSLTRMVEAGEARVVDSVVSARDGGIFLQPVQPGRGAQLRVTLQPETTSCLTLDLLPDGSRTALPVVIAVEEGDETSDLYRDVLVRGRSKRVPPLRLERWAGRTISLRFEAGWTDAAAGLLLRAPVVRRCAEGASRP